LQCYRGGAATCLLQGECDFISVHVPKLKSTEGLIGAAEITKMKKGSYLLNLARGKVVDNEAAAAALHSGRLAGAGFDVYPTEPAGHVTDFKNPLIGCPNTILTPHIGGSTEEAQFAIGIEVAGKIIDYVNNGSTQGAFNMPNVPHPGQLQKGYTRVCNVHRDVPGTMRQINNVLVQGNITYQGLKVDNGVGYLIVDLESEFEAKIKTDLDALEPTIVTYVLQQGKGYCGTGRGPGSRTGSRSASPTPK